MEGERHDMPGEPLSDREHEVLEAVVRSYIETAEPAGSRVVARRFHLGVSPATVRNTMSDLEEKGYLYHPHTSAGRVPTARGYRFYVNSLTDRPELSVDEDRVIRNELWSEGAAIEELIRRAAQVLGLVTQELGVAVAPRLDRAVLERLEFISLGEAKVLLVLTFRAGGMRTIYVDLPVRITARTLGIVGTVLNERLSGLSLDEVRAELPERLRDAVQSDDTQAVELLNIFLDSADEWFDPSAASDADLHLGRASILAEQPEFSTSERMRALLELLEHRDLLRSVVGGRVGADAPHVTIGEEHADPALRDLAVVTSEYRVGTLAGVIGVIGPTRMPYDRVIAFVDATSAMVSDMLS